MTSNERGDGEVYASALDIEAAAAQDLDRMQARDEEHGANAMEGDAANDAVDVVYWQGLYEAIMSNFVFKIPH